MRARREPRPTRPPARRPARRSRPWPAPRRRARRISATISFAFAVGNATNAGQTLTITFASVLNNDLLIASIGHRAGSDGTITAPAGQGWTQIDSQRNSTTVLGAAVFWKRWVTGDSTSAQFSFGVGSNIKGAGVIQSYRTTTTWPANPIVAVLGQVNATAQTIAHPALTSSGHSMRVIASHKANDDPHTQVTDWTKNGDEASGGGGGGSRNRVSMQYRADSTANPGTVTVTATGTNGVSVGYQLTLQDTTAVSRAVASSWESRGLIARAVLTAWMSLQPVSRAVAASWESTQPVSRAVAGSWESTQAASRTVVTSWESIQGVATPVSNAVTSRWESRGGRHYIAVVTGNWSNPNVYLTPNGEIPGDGDTLEIDSGVVLTCDIPRIIGNNPNSSDGEVLGTPGNGRLIIATNIELVVRGSFHHGDSRLTLNPGSTLSLAAKAGTVQSLKARWLNQQNCILESLGTAGNPAKLRRHPTSAGDVYLSTVGNFESGMQIRGEHLIFDGLRDAASDIGIHLWPVNQTWWNTSIKNMVMTGCGRLAFANSLQPNSHFEIDHLVIENTAGPTYSAVIPATTNRNVGITRKISYLAADKKVRLEDPRKFDIDNCLLYQTPETTWNTDPWNSFDDCIVQNAANAPFVLMGPCARLVLLGTNSQANWKPLAVNANVPTSTEFVDVIIDGPTPDSDGDMVVIDNTSAKLRIARRWIVLPSRSNKNLPVGTLVTQTPGPPTAGTKWLIDHCTANRIALIADPSVADVLECLDTIANAVTTNGFVITAPTPATPNCITHPRNNGQWDVVLDQAITTPYAGPGGNYSAGPGTNDVVANPNFVDRLRDIQTWDTSLGGPGTQANALAEIAKNHDFRVTAAAGRTITALRDYIREGYRPTNESYRNAASDGTTPGAVEMAAAGSVSNAITSRWESLQGLAVSRAGAWESTQPLATAVASSWESTQPVAAQAQSAWEATGDLAAAVGSSWESAQALAVAGASGWESLQPVATGTGSAWESTAPATAADASAWESTGAAVASGTTSWESLQPGGVSNAETSAWESTGQLDTAAASSWESTQPVAEAVGSAWESTQPAANAVGSAWESIAPVAAATTTGWESTAVGVVSNAETSAWESTGTAAGVLASAWEAVAPISTEEPSSWESTAPVAAATATGWESSGLLATETPTAWESIQPLAVTQVGAWESLAPVSNTIGSGWESAAGATAQTESGWESTGLVALADESSWESLGAPGAVSNAIESGWESTGELAVSRASGWESIAPAATTQTSSWEALAPVTSTHLTRWASTGRLVLAVTTSWEALAVITTPVANAIITSWASRGRQAAAVTTSWEAVLDTSLLGLCFVTEVFEIPLVEKILDAVGQQIATRAVRAGLITFIIEVDQIPADADIILEAMEVEVEVARETITPSTP